MIDKRTIEDVAETLRGVKGRDAGCCLLIGAGCSVKAGIPTAQGFVDRIEEKHPRAYGRAKKKQYPQCMAQLTWDERRTLVAEYVDSAKINWAHVGIACLIKAGYVDRVLTTNFDPLVIRACSLLNEFPAVYDFASSQTYKPNKIVEKAVVHLHGQRSGFVQLSTKPECDAHAKRMKPVFDDSGSGRSWIVVGYSGESDPVFDQLASVERFDGGLYWVGYEDNDPALHIRKKLLNTEKDAFLVTGHDSDSFFVRLAQELDVFPPSLVALPFTHLADILDTLAPFSLPDQKSDLDVTANARGWIEKATKQFEKSGIASEETQGFEDKPAAIDDLESELTELMMSGDYQAVLERAKTAKEEILTDSNVSELVSWANIMLGNLDSEAANFADAYEKYAAALDIKPDTHEALYNWGIALSNQAETKSGEDADILFTEAYKKYEAALNIKPDKHEAFSNWGAALSHQAETKSGEEAENLFAEAYVKYGAALDIKPDNHEALNNWGTALAAQARIESGETATRLFAEAGEKYKAALDIKPTMHEVLSNWGVALETQARIESGETATRLFAEAGEKFKAALDIKPDMHTALSNWGLALASQGRIESGEAATRLFAEADEKFKAALDIKPGNHEALSGWGAALGAQVKIEDGEAATRLIAEAVEKFKAVLDIKPDNHEAYSNWGVALVAQAKIESGDAAERLFAEAYEKFAAALDIKPDNHEAFRNWGVALATQAKSESGEAAARLYTEADEKYTAALEVKPDKHEALNNWGTALMDRAKGESGEAKARMYAEAGDKFAAVQKLIPGKSSYNLACLNALQGDEKACQTFLRDSRDKGFLPELEHIAGDSDLDSVRHTDWFKEFVSD